jgi:hypothetical protein
MAPADVVREFHDRMQARDWRGAEALLSPAIEVCYPSTRERFVGPAFIAMNETYPDGWSLTVVEVIDMGDRVASRVRVDHGADTFWCAGFYTVRGGLIVDGIEHWLTEGAEEPPTWRAAFTTPEA